MNQIQIFCFYYLHFYDYIPTKTDTRVLFKPPTTVKVTIIKECIDGLGYLASVRYTEDADGVDIVVGHKDMEEYNWALGEVFECVNGLYNVSGLSAGSYTLLVKSNGSPYDGTRHDPSIFRLLPTYEEAEAKARNNLNDYEAIDTPSNVIGNTSLSGIQGVIDRTFHVNLDVTLQENECWNVGTEV